jgi:putative transposase
MRFIETRREIVGVEPICQALGVPMSTYYARRSRTPSARALRDAELVGEIERARVGYRSAYGVRKTWHELQLRGVEVGRERVARLMREQGLQGVRRGRRRHLTVPDPAAERARDLVDRNFTAEAPNQLWVADITYLRSYSGFVYLAFILDVYSRMIVGWQLAVHLRAELVLDALEMAAALRQPATGLIAHSDRGSQYTSLVYTNRLDQLEIAPSVGSVGDAYDNAMAEAFVATLKSELVAHHLHGRAFASFEHAEQQLLSWIAFYNHERLHGELSDHTPASVEQARPCGPPEPGQPALHSGALAGLG